MTTTAQSLINRAHRLLGVTASGETPSSEETADALEALNAMLESWRNDRLLVYCTVDNSLTMVAADASYTVGSGGDLNITRPVKFEDAFMRVSNMDSPVKLIDQYEWDAIPDKTSTSSLVLKAFYNPTMTASLGTLNVWPVPSATNVLHLITWVELASVTSLSATITLPPGYDRLVASNLAIEISPEYPGIAVSPALAKMASDSLSAVKRINTPLIGSVSPLAQAFQHRGSNILIGP